MPHRNDCVYEALIALLIDDDIPEGSSRLTSEGQTITTLGEEVLSEGTPLYTTP